MLRVTPIYGSRFSIQGEAEEPSCTLIEYGGCRVLWNVGFQESLPLLPDHDCVILTDSTLQSLGGIPMYVEQMQARNNSIPPIYATYPSVKMGQMTLYDHHAMLSMDGHTPPYTLEHVDDAFAQIQAIKYSQAMTVYGDDQKPSLQLTAHRASHVVGGAFYVCKRIQDETIVVLTSNYHVAKELHLDSCALLQHGQTPDVLVTHAGGAALRKLRALAHGSPPPVPSLLVTQLERTLQEQVLSTLRRDGNVLLPVDASGRVLELLLLLNQHWERQRLNGAYNLLWLAPMAHNTLEFARSQLEWMAASLGTEFDATTTSPFALKCVQLCSSVAEFDAIVMANQNPTCVLASGLSLEGGPARDVLLKWANNQDNAIIFTDSSQCYLRPNKNEMVVSARTQASSSDKDDDTTAQDAAAVVIPQADVMDVDSDEAAADEHDGGVVQAAVVGDALEVTSEWTASGQLLSAWAEAKLERREMEDSVTIDVKVPRRIPLAGAELKHFLAEEEMKRQKHVMEEEKQAMLREIELAKGQLHLGEQEGGAAVAESRVGASAPNARPKKKSRFDSNLFLKFSKPLHSTSLNSYFAALQSHLWQLF
jgi:cleavage and polyadenylation specificity factor subunit 2